MWTIYDIHRDRYWNAERRCWCGMEEATRYSVEQRNRVPLREVSQQWRFVADWFNHRPVAPLYAA